ncbi:MAG: ABC transporter permease, partial [Bacteroidota bacterium]
MWTNYLKIGLRNLIRDKISALINIGGLAVGMAVALIIALWVEDEMSMNTNHENYPYLAQVMQSQSFNGEIQTFPDIPRPLRGVLENTYGQYFKHLALASWPGNFILTYKEQFVSSTGNYIQEDFPEMISLEMIQGTRKGLKDPNSILLSASLAQSLFGQESPMGKTLKLGNRLSLRVTGIYADLPLKSRFHELKFIVPWKLYVKNNTWVQNAITQWTNNSFQLFVQLQPEQDADLITKKIKDVINQNSQAKDNTASNLALHPMSKWHLYSKFENGEIVGGRIEYVRLYTLIAIFVLFLACINFINLYTARSEKRAKEVGVRKVIGSTR